MYLDYKKINCIIILFLSCAFTIFIFSPISAATVDHTKGLGGLSDTAKESGYKTGAIVEGETKAADQIAIIVGRIIKTIISLLGIIFAILVFMGGFDIVSANGNEELIKKGKERIYDGAKGIVVILISYVIAALAIDWVTKGGEVFNLK